jgi:hypothetical protein
MWLLPCSLNSEHQLSIDIIRCSMIPQLGGWKTEELCIVLFGQLS